MSPETTASPFVPPLLLAPAAFAKSDPLGSPPPSAAFFGDPFGDSFGDCLAKSDPICSPAFAKPDPIFSPAFAKSDPVGSAAFAKSGPIGAVFAFFASGAAKASEAARARGSIAAAGGRAESNGGGG
jgi:hypothetical protein